MPEFLFACTGAGKRHPPYVSANVTDQGLELTVRGPSSNGRLPGATGSVVLADAELVALVQALVSHLARRSRRARIKAAAAC